MDKDVICVQCIPTRIIGNQGLNSLLIVVSSLQYSYFQETDKRRVVFSELQ